jgi:oxygen-dependent protoporphyrinogen oxidase
VEKGRAREPIEGFGFLIPRDESRGMLGCLFVSQLFRGRAPAGFELLHCMLGGAHWPDLAHLPDAAIEAGVAEELERTLGLVDAPPPLSLVRWPRAIPQPGRDHRARMTWVSGRLGELPGLALAGSYVAGVSVADSLASGLSAASRVLAAAPVA